MKPAFLIVAFLTLTFGIGAQAGASLVGSTVEIYFYLPDLNTKVGTLGPQLVNPTASFQLYYDESTTISGTQIVYTSPPDSSQYFTGSFNGYVYDFLSSGQLITGVTVDPASTLPGFNSSGVFLTSDGAGGQLVELNLAGLSFGPRDTVVMDVLSTPEPSGFALFVAMFLAGVTCRRRKQNYVWDGTPSWRIVSC